MTTQIGPTFAAELAAAGLGGTPCVWSSDGAYNISQLTDQQKATFTQVLSAHDPLVPVVPASVTRAQAKIQLYRAGLLPTVQATVDAADGEVKLWFDEALNWQRSNAHVIALGAQLGLTSQQMDAMFIAASGID